MSAGPKTKLTPAEYLARERTAAFKSEFFAGEMFAMAGASGPHNDITENLSIAIGSRFRGGPCRTRSKDQRVLIDATGLYCYPDVVIFCGEPAYAPDGDDTLTNPKAVIEVLSAATEKYDRTTKFRHYRQIATFEEYILVAQDGPFVERFHRQADGTWVYESFDGSDAVLILKSVPVAVPLAEIYARVAFPEPAPRR